MAAVTECIHGFPFEQGCDLCRASRSARGSNGAATDGRAFWLIYAPTIREDTFLHFNDENEHWKIRLYSSPTEPAVELLGTGVPHTPQDFDLASVVTKRIPYPYSAAPDGVSVRNSRYWYDEISRANAQLGAGPAD